MDEDLKKKLEWYNVLMTIPSNIELKDIVVKHIGNNIGFDNIEIKVKDEAKPYVKDLLAYEMLSTVFRLARPVYQYYNQPD